jgi:hypothetical protein
VEHAWGRISQPRNRPVHRGLEARARRRVRFAEQAQDQRAIKGRRRLGEPEREDQRLEAAADARRRLGEVRAMHPAHATQMREQTRAHLGSGRIRTHAAPRARALTLQALS